MQTFFGFFAWIGIEILWWLFIIDEPDMKWRRSLLPHVPRASRRGRPDPLHDDEYYREWQEGQSRKNHE